MTDSELIQQIEHEYSYTIFLAVDIAGATAFKNRSEFYLSGEEEFQRIFSEFDSEFKGNVSKFKQENSNVQFPEILYWKFLGDEVIYRCSVSTEKQIHFIVSAFSLSLIKYDDTLLKDELRMKGSVWGAEFPLRNKQISISISEENEKKEVHDYIGADMDIGFRIGKEVCPSLLTVSMDIVTLLGKVDIEDQVECCLAYHIKLKGVWNNLEYPIFWGRANKVTRIEFGLKQYKLPYYNAKLEFKKARKHRKQILKTHNQIPESLGVIEPFLLNGVHEIPSEYKEKFEKYVNQINTFEKTEVYPNKLESSKVSEIDNEKLSILKNRIKILENNKTEFEYK